MRDDLIHHNSNTKNDRIESLFQEDEDYKLKLASQYDMLSYVGSEIDEVKMDHLTFFKIFHRLPGIEESMRYDLLVEQDRKQKHFLAPVSKDDDNLLGAQSLVNNTGILKTLAISDQLRKDLHELIKETLR